MIHDSPHPIDNVLALTPDVLKQDDKVCGSWCDKRLSEVCDYHVQHAVQRRRDAQPEFSIGTSV
ncbi:hypothetical protein CPB84DRAFT_1778879 [Gymnopilus junonius]|uniref:Zinc finger Mcm10/DnaG-type domain-containing protein n=1 Tax=Gymnopilus junonius TaxID=109634 RepID=A0A9P5NQD0_GYMJU|nr:hypothetical protein CPB84DRAFT_1778879 [Gymnopilus junonius]